MSQSILVCTHRGLSALTHKCLTDIARYGTWDERMLHDLGGLDYARGLLVSDWYRNTQDDVAVLVDDDMVFSIADLDALAARVRQGPPFDIVGAAYLSRDGNTMTGMPLDDVPSSTRLLPMRYVGMGVTAIHRRVLDGLVEKLPLCDTDTPTPFWPMFMVAITQHPSRGWIYIGEDAAFCMRAREAGFCVWLDTSVNVGHLSSGRLVTTDMFEATRRGDDPLTAGSTNQCSANMS